MYFYYNYVILYHFWADLSGSCWVGGGGGAYPEHSPLTVGLKHESIEKIPYCLCYMIQMSKEMISLKRVQKPVSQVLLKSIQCAKSN